MNERYRILCHGCHEPLLLAATTNKDALLRHPRLVKDERCQSGDMWVGRRWVDEQRQPLFYSPSR